MRLINKIVLKPTIKDELSKLFNNLTKGYSKDIRYVIYYIDKGEKLTERPIDLNIKNEFIAYAF